MYHWQNHIFPDDNNPYVTFDLVIEVKTKYFINTLKWLKCVSDLFLECVSVTYNNTDTH